MPASPGGPGSRNKRVVIAVGLLALAVVGYLFFRRSSPASAPAAAAPTPASSPQATDGGGSNAGADAGLLAALAGENQQLLGAFLSSEQGLLSLAGASVGAPTTSASSVAEPASRQQTEPGPGIITPAALVPEPAAQERSPETQMVADSGARAAGGVATDVFQWAGGDTGGGSTASEQPAQSFGSDISSEAAAASQAGASGAGAAASSVFTDLGGFFGGTPAPAPKPAPPKSGYAPGGAIKT